MPIRRGAVLVVLAAFTAKPGIAQQATSPSTVVPKDATHGLDATVAATQEYLKTGKARTVRAGDFLAFPYGRSQPTLTCAPLRTCMIRLQAGETVLGPPALGDSERWIAGLMVTGPGGTTPLVYVKPTDCNITTNLVLSTDRHLYNVTLDSPPCPSSRSATGVLNDATSPYTSHLTFYYPDETAQQWAAQTAGQLPLAASAPGVPPERLNFAYKIDKDRQFPWRPAHVFDDGVHAYIKLPPEARAAAAPVLFVLDDDGTRAILNYALSHDYYVTDRIFRRAVLVIAEGGKERRLTLTNEGPLGGAR